MSQRFAPFEEMLEGHPIWRLQVEDPVGAVQAGRELAHACLPFPEGAILALALRLHLEGGRPLIFHHALLLNSQAFANLKQAGKLVLVFERRGFMSDAKAMLSLDLAALAPTQSGSATALERYVNGYRAELPRLGSPEAVWVEMQRSLTEAPKVTAKRGGVLLLALLLAALAAAAAYLYFGK